MSANSQSCPEINLFIRQSGRAKEKDCSTGGVEASTALPGSFRPQESSNILKSHRPCDGLAGGVFNIKMPLAIPEFSLRVFKHSALGKG